MLKSLGLICLLIAGLLTVVFCTLLSMGRPLDPQYQVPGPATIEIPAAGRYTLWDMTWTRFEGETVRRGPLPDDAVVTITDDGEPLPLDTSGKVGWSIGNSAKESIGTFDVAAAGPVAIDIAGLDEPRLISVSDRTMEDELIARLGGFAYAAAFGVLGALLLLIAWLTRRREQTA